MSAPSRIVDGRTGKAANVVSPEGVNGLVVYSVPYRQETTRFIPAVNDDNGINMAVNGALGGTPDGIHDGTDAVQWTATVESGTKWTVDSTNQANTGTKSIKLDNGRIGDFLRLTRGSDIDLSGYTAITMAVYVDKDWDAASADSIEFFGWNDSLGIRVGTGIRIEDYINESLNDEWQNAVIPLADLTLAGVTIDSLAIEIMAKAGKGPKVYFDDIQVEETGTPIEYRITPRANTKFRVSSIRITMADNITALTYNKFMGLTELGNGVNFSRVSSTLEGFDTTISSLQDFLFVGFDVVTKETDATNTIVTLVYPFPEPVLLDSAGLDYISASVSDDLTSLLFFRMAAIGIEEY